MTTKRIDPPDCGCTDCIVPDGYSDPLITMPLDQDQVLGILTGQYDNSTGYEFEITISYGLKPWE